MSNGYIGVTGQTPPPLMDMYDKKMLAKYKPNLALQPLPPRPRWSNGGTVSEGFLPVSRTAYDMRMNKEYDPNQNIPNLPPAPQWENFTKEGFRGYANTNLAYQTPYNPWSYVLFPGG